MDLVVGLKPCGNLDMNIFFAETLWYKNTSAKTESTKPFPMEQAKSVKHITNMMCALGIPQQSSKLPQNC